jgi:hypothetical protein
MMAADSDNAALQGAFLDWLADARPRLLISVHVRHSTPEVIEFGFEGADSVLVGSLIARGDLVVAADWQGDCWDFLLSEEVRPQQVKEGIVCSICEREGRHRIFPTMQALWRDHLFLPLENWINTKVAIAKAIALYQTPNGGARWARLISPSDRNIGSPTFWVDLPGRRAT